MTLSKEEDKNRFYITFFFFQTDNHRKEHHVEPNTLNGKKLESNKLQSNFISDAIKKSRAFMKHSSDSNNNYSKEEEYFTADQNNNDSDIKKNFEEIRNSKLGNHRMQQLLQQHVFTPHQVN